MARYAKPLINSAIASPTAKTFLIVDNSSFLYRIRNTVRKNAAIGIDPCPTNLQRLGQEIRARRKALGVNATNAAESAGISRVTLHRIEKGEPSVNLGAYMNVIASLGLSLVTADKSVRAKEESSIPIRVKLSEYAGLKQLAWQVHGLDTLTPIEARDIYERNWRHLEISLLDASERHLINALKIGLGGNFPLI